MPWWASNTPHSPSTVDADCRSWNVSTQFEVNDRPFMHQQPDMQVAERQRCQRVLTLPPLSKPREA